MFTQQLMMWDKGSKSSGNPNPITPYYYLFLTSGESEVRREQLLACSHTAVGGTNRAARYTAVVK